MTLNLDSAEEGRMNFANCNSLAVQDFYSICCEQWEVLRSVDPEGKDLKEFKRREDEGLAGSD